MRKLIALLLVLVTVAAFAGSASAKAVGGGIVYETVHGKKLK